VEIAAGELLLVQRLEDLEIDGLLGKAFLLLFRTVAPHDAVRLA
jgi:hypothetical protein